ncbi:phosphorylase family protein [Methylolobus aquaticus]
MDDAEAIGYVVALPPECRTLTSEPARRGDILSLNSGHRVAVAGAGAANAAAAAETLVAQGVRRLVSWGCAGALSDELLPGDLVIPRELVFADGTTARLAGPWHEQLLTRLQPTTPIRTESITESVGIVASSAAKRSLHAASGAIATDMESGAVARTAQKHGVPWLAIRSIVDAAAVTLPRAAQAALDRDGEMIVSRLLLQLLRTPTEIAPLLRLGRAFRLAMQTLSAVKTQAGLGLGQH